MLAHPTRRLRQAAGLAAAALATSVAAAGCGTAPAPVTNAAGATATPAGRAAAAIADQPPPQPSVRRPNVVLLTADDASVQDLRYMPYTQKLLVDRGVTFSDALSPSPICVPARASLVTGQYAHNHHALTIGGAGGGYAAFTAHGGNRRTLPVWLQRAGYDTLFIGKYLNGYADNYRPAVEPGWSDWRAAMGMSTYSFVHTVMDYNGRVQPTTQYSTDLFSDQTMDVLSDPRRRTRPFYLWVNYVAPHEGGHPESDDPQTTNPDHPQDWVDTTMPAPRNKDEFKDLNMPDVPSMFVGNGPGQTTAGTPMDAIKKAAVREAYQQRIEALQAVDQAVARTVNKLKAIGQYKNTIIMFTSDNGFSEGEHNIFGKLWQFNEMLRIPVVMAGPGVPVHKTVHTVITNPDIAVTIAALAHAKPTRVVDGVNIMPLLRGSTVQRVIPLEAYPLHGGLTPIYTGIRVGNWTYIRTRNGHEELYNRSIDPYELSNLGIRRKYAGDVAWLRALNVRYMHCAGATCPKRYVSPARMTQLRQAAVFRWNHRPSTPASPTPGGSPAPTPAPSPTASGTPAPSDTSAPSPTPSDTSAPSPTPSDTSVPSATPLEATTGRRHPSRRAAAAVTT